MSQTASSADRPVRQERGKLVPLLLGIKRLVHRYRDARAAQADAQYRASRKPALERDNYTCIHCGFRSKETNQVHHKDDNHGNNHPDNLGCNCQLCHPYHHIGEAARSATPGPREEGHLGPKAAQLFRVPNAEAIPASDMNHLLRALALALNSEEEAETAKQIFALFSNEQTRQDMVTHYASFQAKDMAAGMAMLTDDEYAQRGPAVAALRVLYNPKLLKQWGQAWGREQPALSDARTWPSLLSDTLTKVCPPPQAVEQGVGAEALMAAAAAHAPADPPLSPPANLSEEEDAEEDEDIEEEET